MIDVSSGDTGEGTVSPLQLRFTPMNWNQTQTVTVTGVNDDGDDGDVAWQVRLDPASSDPDYNGLTNVDTTDNDTAGVLVTPTMWTLREQYPSAGSGTYTVVLAAQPAGPVTVDATVVSSTTATVGPTESPTLRRLVFMAGNWATAQTVTDGNTAEGSALITHTPVTGYSGVTSGPLVTVSEDEDMPLVVGAWGHRHTGGAGGERAVGEVTFGGAMVAPARYLNQEVTAAPALTFVVAPVLPARLRYDPRPAGG